jgi:hypothetical protein
MLSALGRREEALAATQEAADLYRDLAQQNPQAFLPDLAMSLNNLGNRLSALGRREEALAALGGGRPHPGSPSPGPGDEPPAALGGGGAGGDAGGWMQISPPWANGAGSL